MKSLPELKKKYPNIHVNVLKSYIPEDTHVIFHEEDRDLDTIKVALPKAPDLHLIEGFNKKAKDQKFQYEQMSDKLAKLPSQLLFKKRRGISKPMEVFLTVEEIWMHLEENKEEFKEEIHWIELQWYHRWNGKWYFIKGKPTYLNGWCWFFVNYYKLVKGGKYPEYRDSNRRWYIIQKFLYDLTTDELGIDHKKRLLHGTNNMDARRKGKSSRALCIHLDLITSHMNWEGGIQGMDANNGEEMFIKHLVYDFKNLPFFFKPAHEGSTDVKTKLILKPGSVHIGSKGTFIDDRIGLDSSSDFATTASKGYYDKRGLNILNVDEPGKTKLEDVAARHQVLKECCNDGGIISGWMIYTTTVEETTADAMKQFTKVCEASHWGERKQGATNSGLVNVFMSAADGRGGYIDEYGASVIETPEKPVKGSDGKMIHEGSLSEIRRMRSGYRNKKDFDGLAGFIRKHPLTYRECFTPSADEISFNREILESTKGRLEFDFDPTVWGYLEFRGGIFGGDVEFISCSNREEADWIISKKPSPEQRNKKYQSDGIWYPLDPKHTGGGDAFTFSKTKTDKPSKGGLAVVLDYDDQLDGKKEIEEWDSFSLVATYQKRPPTTKDFAIEALKACIYWSMIMLPERNIPIIEQYFVEWGYQGFLMRQIKINNKGFEEITPYFGYDTKSQESKQRLFRNTKDYIQTRGKKCNHLEYIDDCLKIRGLQDLGKFDRFTAVCLALEGSKSKYKDVLKNANKDVDLKDFLEFHTY